MILKDMVKPLYRLLKYVFLKIKYVFLCKNNCLDNFLKGKEDFSLFITHSLGGGTFQYEKNYIRENLEKKIMILRIFSYGKDLCYRLENKESEEELYISPSYISKVFDKKFKEIIINSLIQIYDLFSFIDLLLEYKTKYPKIRYTYHVHDFHCVCPNVNLFYNGWDCNLCCESNSCQFTKFTDRYDGSIKDWREKWNKLFMLMDEIVCFSENSASILNKAFNNKYSNLVVIRPHDMSYCKFSPINSLDKLSLNIGIVGSVYTEKKGKNIIRLFSEKLNSNIPITIVGATSSQMGIYRKNVKCLGKYNHSDLQSIIEKEKITHIFFTSVCAETFSYLVSELMMMELPIVCFDFGAQADKVKSYSKGIVVKNIDEAIKVFEDLQ